MATAKPIASTPSRRLGRRLLLALAVMAVALLAWFWRPLNAWGIAGAAYGARVACSCRHIEGRDLGDCRKDFKPGMAPVWLSEDEAARSVTASLPLLASQTATFRPGEGCLLERWED